MTHSHTGSLRKHAVRAAGWSFAEKWLSRVFSLIVFAVLGHMLPIRDFGLVALATVVVDFLMVFADQGVSRSVVVERNPTKRFFDTAFYVSTIGGFVFLLLAVATAGPVATALGASELKPMLQVLSVVFVLYGISNVQQAMLQRDLRFGALAMRRVVSTIIGGVAGIVAAFMGAGAWSLVIQTIVSYGVGAVALCVSARYVPGLQFGRPEAKKVTGFGMSVVGIDLLSWASRNGDNLIVGSMLGPVALGIYSVAFKIFSIVTELVVGVLSSSALPLFAKVAHDRALMARSLIKANDAASAITAPVFALLGAEAASLIPLVYGPKWTDAVVVVQILCVAGVLTAATSMDRSVLLATGHQKMEFVITAAATALSIAAFLIGVQWGYVGVAVSLAVRAYLFWPVRLWALHRVTGVSVAEYVWNWFRTIIAACGLVAVALAIRNVVHFDRMIIDIIVSGAPALATYLLLLFVLHPGIRTALPTALSGLRERSGQFSPTGG